jgi:pimeloyl-ACP methyl ester carboxylesterase
VQALEHLPRSKTVRVHGHSRGGAVVLEASKLRPDLFEDVEVVLEAPVLPKAKLFMEASPILVWLYPFFIVLWKRSPLSRRFVVGLGRLDDPRKRELLSGLSHNPKRISAFVANVKDLLGWMRRGDATFAYLKRGVVLVPSDDRVLDPVTMLASAKNGALEVVEVEGSSHFITLDRPGAIPTLRGSPTQP